MKARQGLHFAVALAATALAAAGRAADPAASTQPATAPAAVPVVPALQPREVVEAFMIAVITADEKGVFGNLAYANDDARKEAEAVLGEAIAQQQLDNVLAMAYEKQTPGKPAPEDLAGTRISEVKQRLAGAQVVQKDDTAELPLGEHASIYLVKKDGVWKVDFAKTQRANEGPAEKEAIANAAARAKIYRDVMAMVKAGKFSSAKQANEEVKSRIDDLPKPKAAAGGGDDAAKIKRAVADLANLKTAVQIFEVDNARYPSQAEGLSALVKMPASLAQSQTWNKQLDAVPKDPWGHEYVYRRLEDGSFDIISAGPDGKVGTDDDVVARPAR